MNPRRRLSVHDGNRDSTEQAERDKTLLVVREAIILESESRPLEYSGCIHEVQPMLFQVETPFPFIPGKPHRHIVYTPRLCVKLSAFALTTQLSGRPPPPLRAAEHAIHCEDGAPTMNHGPLKRVVSHHAGHVVRAHH